MATGENFLRICNARNQNKNPIKVDKATELKINNEIKALQEYRSSLCEDDNLTDDMLLELIKPLNEKIDQLIKSQY